MHRAGLRAPNPPRVAAHGARHGLALARPKALAVWEDRASATFMTCYVLSGRKLQRRRVVGRKSSEKELRADSLVPDVFVPGMERKMLGLCLLGATLPAWGVLPVLLDLKIAADAALPGLTAESLPITTTAMFVGWFASCSLASRALSIFAKEQLVVSHMVAMMLVALATVSLPGLTSHSLAVLTAVRFVQGFLFCGVTGIMQTFILSNTCQRWKNPLIAIQWTAYSLVAMIMSWACSGNLDWRSEELLWCGLPPLLVLLLFFPDWSQTLKAMVFSLPKVAKVTKLESEPVREESMRKWRNIAALACVFLTCGACSYGLNYSAGKLSDDPYMSTIFLSGVDILGYLAVLSLANVKRITLQQFGFIGASLCLLLCSAGEPGSGFALTFALIGRLCLDVCYTTIYLVLTDVFKGSSQKDALGTCEVALSAGTIIAPLCGTLPTTIFCPFFAALCLVSACATRTLPRA